MPIQTVLAALRLPASARVDQPIAKKLLTQQGAPTAADKRLITEAIDVLTWHAALKPATVGLAAFSSDATRPDVIELMVVSLRLRADVKPAQARRLRELIHRAIAYPVLLVAAQGDSVTVSLAELRYAVGQSAHTGHQQVLDALHASDTFTPCRPSAIEHDYLTSLAIDAQPWPHLGALYQGWVHRTHALRAARLTGVFRAPVGAQAALAQRAALALVSQLNAEVAAVRALAIQATQLSRQVALNLRLRELQEQLQRAALGLVA